MMRDLRGAGILVIAVVCLVQTGCGCSQAASETSAKGANTTGELHQLKAELERIKADVAILRNGISPEFVEFLTKLEQTLNQKREWPDTADKLEALRKEFGQISLTLSPMASYGVHRQMVRLGWGLDALKALQVNALPSDDPEALDHQQAALSSLVEAMPEQGFEELRVNLVDCLKKVDQQMDEVSKKRLLEEAEAFLKAPGTQEQALVMLNGLDELPADPEVEEKRKKLRGELVRQNLNERLTGLETQLKNGASLQDLTVCQHSFRMVQDQLLTIAVDLETATTADQTALEKTRTLLTSCDRALSDIATAQRARVSTLSNQYQGWALKQIQAFDGPDGWQYDTAYSRVTRDLDSFKTAGKDEDWVFFVTFGDSMKQLVQEKSGVDLSTLKGAMLPAERRKKIYSECAYNLSWKNSIDKEIAYRATRDGMVKFLLPIEVHLLDPPVQELYQRAYRKAWDKLGDRPDDQLYVAQQAAKVTKKTLEDMPLLNP